MIEKLLEVCAYFYQDKEILNEILDFQIDIYNLIESSLKKEKFDCKEGCYYCCLGWKVNATLPEILILIDGLNLLPFTKREEIYRKLNSFKKEKVKYYTPCPLLEDSRCVVYHYRPMICRLYSSYDSKLCENKIKFEFPEIVQDTTYKIKKKIDLIEDFFKPFFETKIYITEIKFDNTKKLFYLDMFSILKIFVQDGKIKIEKGEKFPL